MDWIAQNWVWVLFAVGMIAMHMFGHGGHGSHRGHGGGESAPQSARKDGVQHTSEHGSGHHH